MTATPQLPQEQIDALLKIYNEFKDPEEFMPNALTVQDRQGLLVPFNLKTVQRRFVRQVKAQRARGQPVRQLVDKTRRIGMSYIIAGLIYHATAFDEGQSSLTLAHEKSAAVRQFTYFDNFQTNYRVWLNIARPPLMSRNASEDAGALRWRNRSSVEIGTANNVNFSRSFDFRFLQLAEYAYYRNIRALMTSLIPTVPEDINTMIFKESTANGYNEFWREWEAAMEGKSEYEAFFAGCFEDEQNWRAIESDPERFEQSLDDTEWMLIERHNLVLEQINWRRFKLREFEGDLRRFDQEYPHSWEVSFQSSGRQRFDPKLFLWMNTTDDGTRGELETDQINRKDRLVFNPRADGVLTIWKRFKRGMKLIGGADVAKGVDVINEGDGTTQDPDYDGACIGDRNTGEQIMELHCRLEPTPYAKYLYDLGAWALQETGDWIYWVVEVEFSGGNGRAVLTEMVRLGYPLSRLYKTEQLDETTKKLKKTLGFEIRPNTRPLLLSNFERYVIERAIILRSKRTHSQIKTFVRKGSGKIEHEAGAHDDSLFGAMYFAWGMEHAPVFVPETKPRMSALPDRYAQDRLTPAEQERIRREARLEAAKRRPIR
jgi:hypothetical protein